jgi:hypothetical protein
MRAKHAAMATAVALCLPLTRALPAAAARLRDFHNQIINNSNPERLALLKQSGVARTG